MRTKFERREAAQTARSAAPEGKKVPANGRESTRMGENGISRRDAEGGLKEGGRPAHCCWEDLFDGRREVFLGFWAREWEK
jgi:hypothetical protein